MTFETLGLSQPVLQALELKGYGQPTPIQEQSIPYVLDGRDLLGIAQTGTGKTAAFMLPSIDRLIASDKRPKPRCCRMLVLAPTRELAGQIAESAREYGQFSHLKVVTVFGGTSVNKNRQDVARGVDILIATPGRLVDLTEQNALDLSQVEILVLDEADQMMDLGFIHALRAIVRLLPKQRQTLFFSATMPNAIKQLAGQYLTDPAQVSVTPAATTAERVEQYVCFVGQPEKQGLLTLTLRAGFKAGEMDRVLVFTRTKHGADRVVKKLVQSNIRANAIHGNKSQPQRERALDEFKQGSVKVLVATDIAARGIDISGVSHVVNFELPNVAEQYVHRIGRTARAGREGVAISFCANDERDYLRDIQRLTKVTLDQVPLPEGLRDEVAIVAKHAEPVRGPRRQPGRGQPPRRDTRTEAQRDARGEVRVEPRGQQGERRQGQSNGQGERRPAHGGGQGERRPAHGGGQGERRPAHGGGQGERREHNGGAQGERRQGHGGGQGRPGGKPGGNGGNGGNGHHRRRNRGSRPGGQRAVQA
ncbi:DEAD/DEAH box helicase [Croceibacterium sp. LX-88]|uniref:DEAD/DEAH box helicase n=1 Tax=Croceibacterium selenioxidans TaxID=2838833 RepID=A0ABS5W4J9_9SPHN|nr:DEAD/DEAH box helicase [Croceibacterium selenioxidans]MBT2134007.1 DEAD/DEAH box helicase [Croceibacterium selenioxidans]